MGEKAPFFSDYRPFDVARVTTDGLRGARWQRPMSQRDECHREWSQPVTSMARPASNRCRWSGRQLPIR